MTVPFDSVVEIATFRTQAQVRVADVVIAAQRLDAFLGACPGFVARHLSCGADGIWTDHVLWTSLGAAEEAGRRVMDDPRAAPFMALIDAASVAMRHDPVLHLQRAA
jgi:hypothetical protein